MMRYQATNFLFLIISSFTVPFVHYSVLCKDKFLGCMKKFEWDSQSIKSSLTPCGHHQMSGRLWIRPERSMLKLYNFVFFPSIAGARLFQSIPFSKFKPWSQSENKASRWQPSRHSVMPRAVCKHLALSGEDQGKVREKHGNQFIVILNRWCILSYSYFCSCFI